MHMPNVHDSTSFTKYMEKCVRLLIEYLTNKPNWHSQFVLAMQWNILMKTNNTTSKIIHLKFHQKNSIFPLILSNFLDTACKYAQQINHTTSKSKIFNDFFISCYELYQTFESHIKLSHFDSFSKLIIHCYCLCTEKNLSNDETGFQETLAFCAKQMNERSKMDKITKKT